jgi:tetratricopeptide (TPR) repeat protein
MFLSACLALLASLTPPAFLQSESGGLDAVAAALRERTAERRTAAAKTWETQGEAFLKEPEGSLKSILLNNAPEIQDPILQSLKAGLGAKTPDISNIDAHLKLLRQVVNASGADRLARLLDDLPGNLEIGLFETLALQGGATSLKTLESRIRGNDDGQRIAALLVLLKHGPMELCQSWMGLAPPDKLGTSARISALLVLADRELPADFALLPIWLTLQDSREHDALFRLFLAHPQKDAEKLVLDLVLDSNRLPELRENGLEILENGVQLFNWRNSKRKLGAILRDKEGDPLAVETAWVLHRMGEKMGKKFLLAGPEAEVRRNRANWRSHLTLGELQVKLGEFRDAYKSFHDAIEIAAARRGRLRAMDYLYAARAAAGARKPKEAGDWLARTRMSASELAPYRNLPEFQPLLDKQPFIRLFGL